MDNEHTFGNFYCQGIIIILKMIIHQVHSFLRELVIFINSKVNDKTDIIC